MAENVHHGALPYFEIEHVFTLDKPNERKPSLKPFKTFLQETNLKPEEVLFVGDSLERDVKGASKAGLKTALAKYGQIQQKKKKGRKTKIRYVDSKIIVG